MRYRHLGDSGLEVSEIGLGANNFGEPRCPRYKTAERVIHAAIAHGINFIDTSNVYAQGLSESYIGRALKGRRYEMLIGTKFGSKREHGPNRFGGSRKFVMDAVDESLKRLRTDHIDLYMIHRPDPRLPLEETLRAMDDLVRQGKVLYIGCCNFEAWRMVEAVWCSKIHSISRFISSQFEYSMLNRSSEAEMLPACRSNGVGVIPYLPLAAGFLSGKVRGMGAAPVGSRLALDPGAAERWVTAENLSLVEDLKLWTNKHGKTILELAFSWLLSEPLVSTVIASASSVEQVVQNSQASQWQLTTEERSEVNRILEKRREFPIRTYYSRADYFSDQTVIEP